MARCASPRRSRAPPYVQIKGWGIWVCTMQVMGRAVDAAGLRWHRLIGAAGRLLARQKASFALSWLLPPCLWENDSNGQTGRRALRRFMARAWAESSRTVSGSRRRCVCCMSRTGSNVIQRGASRTGIEAFLEQLQPGPPEQATGAGGG